jgi:hypothetical protein
LLLEAEWVFVHCTNALQIQAGGAGVPPCGQPRWRWPTSLAIIVAAGTYLRCLGPWAFIAGILLFISDFLGFFLHGAVTLGNLGWLAAEIGVGIVVALLYPRLVKAM